MGWEYSAPTAKANPFDAVKTDAINQARTDFTRGGEQLDRFADHLEIVADDPGRVTRNLLAALAKEWVKLVRGSTWKNPVPADESSIIADISNKGGGLELEIGWYPYRGRRMHARNRMNLRLRIFIHDIIPRVLGL